MEKQIFTDKLSAAVGENLGIELNNAQKEQMFFIAERLVETNKVMNLTAITDEDGIILRHLVDSLMINSYFKQNSNLIDIGCGAGFPSLPLAVLRPDLSVMAVDSTEKRVKYVAQTAELLGLTNVKTICARAEELAGNKLYREAYDYATARAVASLPVLCELTIPFVKLGGSLVAMKAKGAREEFEESRSAIRRLCGASSLEKSELTQTELHGFVNGEEISENRTVITVPKLSPTPPEFPRKFSQIKKSPL